MASSIAFLIFVGILSNNIATVVADDFFFLVNVNQERKVAETVTLHW